MKIGIISDTHDHLPNIRKAVQLFRLHGIHHIIHAGDFCSPFTIPEFKGFEVSAVFGNNDGDHYRILMKMKEINAIHHGEYAKLQIGNRKIGVYHGTQPDITEALLHCAKYDVIISGHTHEAHISHQNDTLWINPGSAHGFEKDATAALYDCTAHKGEILIL